MERLSTDIYALRKAAWAEIDDFQLKEDETIISRFSEFPSIAGFPYSIVLIQQQDETIRSSFRQWDTEYDMNRWQNGIYNLDRLRMITHDVSLSNIELKNGKEILIQLSKQNLPNSLNNTNGIVLDGSHWKLGITTTEVMVAYEWRASNDAIELFVPLIEFMKNLHVSINKRR